MITRAIRPEHGPHRPRRRRLLHAGLAGVALASVSVGRLAWAQATPAGAGAAGLAAPGDAAHPGPATDETWLDTTRQRALPLRIRWPALAGPVPAGGHPVVLYSHGLGGSTAGGEVWGEAWAAAGCVVLHVQHPGSDEPALRQALRALPDRSLLQQTQSPTQLLARLQDLRFVLDELARRQAGGPTPAALPWADVRPQAVGLAGHSFGAHTTLGMAGQRYAGATGVDEPRLAAFIAFSPSLPAQGDAVQAFAALTRPMLCVTGTRDGDVVGNGATPERRRAVFDALPPGHKARLLLAEADHASFAGQTAAGLGAAARLALTREWQPRHHALVARLTADWWRAHLMADTAAAGRLAHPWGLGEGDRWDRG